LIGRRAVDCAEGVLPRMASAEIQITLVHDLLLIGFDSFARVTLMLGIPGKYNTLAGMRKLLWLFLVLSAVLRANDAGELIESKFVSKKFGFSVPVDAAWYLGPSTKSGNPSLVYRISPDQVLNIVFSENETPAPVAALAQAYLDELKVSPNFKLLTPIKTIATRQNLKASYFDFQRGADGEVAYRQGILMIPTRGNPLVLISVTETSEDPAYMIKALDLMKAITLDPDRLPAVSTTKEKDLQTAYLLGKRIGQYGVVCLPLIAIVIWLAVRSSKRSSRPPPLPKM
jgi:hypothetical protein